MEPIEIIGELIIALLDGGTIMADIYSWIKGKENRIERRGARSRGEALPPRDKWNRRVIVLTMVFFLLTSILVAWRL